MEPGQRRRNTTYAAPIGCVDLAAFDQNSEPYEIHGCDYCLPWHAEVQSTSMTMAMSSSGNGMLWNVQHSRS